MMKPFIIEPAPPFRLDLTVWALRRRPHNAIDRWDGETYGRTLSTYNGIAEVEVRQTGRPEVPRLSVSTDVPGRQARDDVTGTLKRMLGLGVDLSAFYRQAEGDHQLSRLVRRFRGVKPPRFPTMFECLVNAVACQQLSLTVGIGLLNRLTERYGRVATRAGPVAPHAFPEPADLAAADPSEVRGLGFSTAKARALVELGDRASNGELDLERISGLGIDEAAAALEELRGIGRWSAEYALLRGAGRLSVFPADDVGARNNLQRFLHLDPSSNYEAIRRAVSRWAPYAGLVYFHLLLDRLGPTGPG